VALSATVPLALEVVQDTTPDGGEPREEDGLYTGGRSARGFLALSSTGVSETEGSGQDNTGGSVDVTVRIPLVSTYTRYELSQRVTLLQLFSSLVAWAGLVGAGVHLLSLHDAVVAKMGLDVHLHLHMHAGQQQNKKKSPVSSSVLAVLAEAPPPLPHLSSLSSRRLGDAGAADEQGRGGGKGGGTTNPLQTSRMQHASVHNVLRSTFEPVSAQTGDDDRW
jgi:hypothetical protein